MDTAPAKGLLRLASAIQREAEETGLIKRGLLFGAASTELAPEPLTLYDQVVTQPTLRNTTRQLYANGHYALAVEEAYKCLNNVVKVRSKSPADGANMMKSVFSVQNPVLKVNALRSVSQRDQQLGYMEIFAGCMTGIRNPRAHEHQYADEAEVALEMLIWANHLLRMALTAKRARKAK